jgi:ABC-type sugar transport system permease subunit/ABC-type glycerol-3-phosphate transport system substrate-binding protein
MQRSNLERLGARCVFVFVLFLLSVVSFGEAIQLRMAVWDGNDGLPVLREELRNFEKAHPGIKVKLENVEFNTYFQKQLSQMAANVAPDVMMLGAGQIQMFAKRDMLLPLDPFIESTPGFDLDAYYKSAIQSSRFKGSLYILPRDVAPVGIVFYNKDAFREAGIPFPDGTWTWDYQERPELKEKDFIWVMHQLTKFDKNGKATRWGYSPAWPGILAELFVYSSGARFVDNDEAPTKVLFDDPRIIKGYQWAADLALKYHYMPTQTQINSEMQSNAAQLFASGKIAMFQGGVWETQGIRNKNVLGSPEFFDWDVALAPAFKDGTRAATTGGSGYSIVSQTKYPKESWELVRWMAGRPGMEAMARAGFAQPAIKSMAKEPPWLYSESDPPDRKYPVNKAVMDEAAEYAITGSTADYWQQITDLVSPRNDQIWNGTATAEDVLKTEARLGNAEIKKIMRQKETEPFNWPAAIVFGLGILFAIIGWVYLPERGQKLSSRGKIENRIGYLFIMPGLIGLLLFAVGPMLVSLLMSTAKWDILTPAGWRGLGNYHDAFFDDGRFWKAIGVSAIYTVITVPMGVIASLGLAVLLNTKLKAMPIFRTIFYLPALASTVAASLIWQKVFQKDGGLLNVMIFGTDGTGNLLGIGGLLHAISGTAGPVDWLGNEQFALFSICLMSLWGVGGGMIILLAGLQGVPQHYYEAAELDGASPWRQFRTITVPMVAPSLFFVTVTGVIGSFQVFTQAFVVTKGGPNDATRFYMLHLYEEAFRNLHMGYASALAWILFVVIAIVTALQFKVNKYLYYESEVK